MGNRIVDVVSGTPAILRGVNRSGLEYGPAGSGIGYAEIETIASHWRANAIRLTFNQEFVLRGRPGSSSSEYLDVLDRAIQLTASCGAYTVLALQWLSVGRKIAPLPDAESVPVWRLLAERFGANPAVIFDLYSEPHDVPAGEWRRAAADLLSVVRASAPSSLVCISGVDWGYDLRGIAIPADNVVYSTHVYSHKLTSWADAFGRLAVKVPVFVGEFGGAGTPEDLDFGKRLLAYMGQLGIGGAAWSWCDEPRLVREETPTAFGELVRAWLSETTKSPNASAQCFAR